MYHKMHAEVLIYQGNKWVLEHTTPGNEPFSFKEQEQKANDDDGKHHDYTLINDVYCPDRTRYVVSGTQREILAFAQIMELQEKRSLLESLVGIERTRELLD
jgi:hypothetical protein